MRQSLALLVALLVSTCALAGCQCCHKTECYSDVIDDVSDHTFCMDRFYSPTCDLTRIGYSDWCESELNRTWCSLGCKDGACCRHAAAEVPCDDCESHTIPAIQ